MLMPDEQIDFADTVGCPAFRVEIEIVDEDGQPRPAGEVGRLRYRGPGVSRLMVSADGIISQSDGAWNEPGDLARMLPSGHVQLAGRAEDIDDSRWREHLSGRGGNSPARITRRSMKFASSASATSRLGEPDNRRDRDKGKE